jgi:hypothetical protein
MASDLDRVRNLIALSASPNENEARNAAYTAVKLIRKNGFEVVAKGVRPVAAPSTAVVPAASRRGTSTPMRKVVTGEPTQARAKGVCAHCGEEYERKEWVASPSFTDPGFLTGRVHAECAALWRVPTAPSPF